MGFLTPELATALGGIGSIGAALLVAWFSLHMTKLQAEDSDKRAEREANNQQKFMTFVESQMKLMAEVNTKMAEVVLQSTAATQEQSKATHTMIAMIAKNNEILNSLPDRINKAIKH